MSILRYGKTAAAALAVIFSLFITSCSGVLSDYAETRDKADSQKDGYAVLYDKPADPTNSQYIDIRVGGRNVKYYMYEIDGIKWSQTFPVSERIREGVKTGDGAFTGRYVSEPLSEGLHIIKVVGFKSLENLASAQPREFATTCIWRVDITPPIKDDIILTGQPDNITGDTSATITVSGFDIAGYKYRLEILSPTPQVITNYQGAFIGVSRKIKISSMIGDPVTEYRLSVIAIDGAGNAMTTDDPKVAIWRVDVTQPIAKFINKPDKYTKSRDINVTVGGSNSRFTVFEYSYRLDSEPWSSFVSTRQKITATGLAKGEHILQARARGYDRQNGNAVMDQSSDTPTIYTWTILVSEDMTITVTRFPSENPTMATYARITVTGGSGDYVRYYRYRLDGGKWSGNTDIWKETLLTRLKVGQHAVDVIGIDLAGNVMAVEDAVSVEWEIIPYVPSTAVLGNLPSNPTNDTQTDIDVLDTASDGITHITGYQYILDSGMLSEERDDADNIVESGLGEGDHLLRVFGENEYGAWQPFTSPTGFSWEIDLTYPVAVLDPDTLPVLQGQGVETSNFINIRVGGDDVVNYRYRLDGGSWSDAASISELIVETGLTSAEDGYPHTLEVIGQDIAGNWQGHNPDGTPLANLDDLVTKITWLVDADLPTVNAGTDKITNTAVYQEAFASSPLGITDYQWEMISGPTSGHVDFTNESGGAISDPGDVSTTISADIDGTYVLNLVVTDSLGNTANSTMTLEWDTAEPRISSITSTSNGTYIIGNTVNITVSLDEQAQLSTGGTLDVTLETGAADAVVHLAGTGYRSVFTGTYTVTEGHQSADLDCTAVSVTGSMTDEAGNGLSLEMPETTIADGSNIIVDGVPPRLLSAETIDLDINGRIDHYMLTFDQAVSDSSFPGYSANNAGSTQGVWVVQGYAGTVLSHGTHEAALGDVANDAVIYLSFTEATDFDSGAAPTLAVDDSPALTDANGNTMGFTDFILDAGNGVYLYQTGIDGAAPVIVSASGTTGTTSMIVTFSESSVDTDSGAGACSGDLDDDAIAYDDNNSLGSTAGTLSGSSDKDACDGRVAMILTGVFEGVDINTDEVSARSADAYYDASNNEADTTVRKVGGAVAPYVLSAFATSATTFRLRFSEPVNETQATTISNYTFGEETGGDPGNACTNISTITAITRVDSAGAIYEFTNSGVQCTDVTYQIEVDDPASITDVNDGVSLREGSTTATFFGNEDLRVVAGTCSTSNLNQMTVVFNKPVFRSDNLSDPGNAENTDYYKFRGPYYDNMNKPLGTIWGATRGGEGLESEVTIRHNQEGMSYYQQKKVGYMVIVSDGYAGTNRVHEDSSITDSSSVLQSDPKDRVTWNGCGETVDSFSGGPISVDPFGDSSTFGYVVKYRDWVYIGPNKDGNTITGMDPDGTNPLNHGVLFAHDTTGSRVHDNGGWSASTPYVSIGHTGCTSDSTNVTEGCGPDNEDGRGLFASGTINDVEYLFFTASREGGNNDYIYRTSDTDETLNFGYMDLEDTIDNGSEASGGIGGNKGTESMEVFNDELFWMQPGDRLFRPYLVRIMDVTASDLVDSDDSSWMDARNVEGIGVYGTKKNYADKIGGTLFGFNGQLYLANSGSITNDTTNCNANTTPADAGGANCQQTGGIVRYNPSSGVWTDITPPTTLTDFSQNFSIVLLKIKDLIPAERPYPAFTSFEGNLYVIRNACTRTMVDRSETCITSYLNCPADDDVSCSAAGGTPVPQLWKCEPGADSLCDSNEWSLVAENGTSGITNMGDTDNTHITMLIANGGYLYVGFDNATDGVKIYRTGSTSPSGESDFDSDTGVSGIQTFAPAGLNDPTRIKQLYSAITIPDGASYYIYISAGFTDLVSGQPVPVAVYRQRND